MALLFCLVLGLSLLVAVLHAHYRDVEPVLAAALLPWFFLTPIFLPVDDLPGIERPPAGRRPARVGQPGRAVRRAVRDVLYAGAAPARRTSLYVARRGRSARSALGVLRVPADGARPGGGAVSLAAARSCSSSATRSFRLVHERPRTLKELFVSLGPAAGRAACTRCATFDLHVEPGEAVGHGRPQRRRARPRTLRCLAGIVPLDSGRAECGGRVVSLLELGAGFGPDFTGRENI